MARGRMLSKDISLDEKVDALSDDTARLLFTWMIPHLDVEGRMYGDAQVFKSIVAPRRNYTLQKVERILTEMEKLGLIERYWVGCNQFLLAPNFEKHQVGLRKDKEIASKIPPKDGVKTELGRSKDGKTPPQVKEKLKLKRKEKNNNSSNNHLEESNQTNNLSEEMAEIAQLYEAEIGKITPLVAQELNDAIQNYPAAWIKDAIKEAVKQNKRKWSYVRGILNHWKESGHQTQKVSKDDPDRFIKGKYGHMVRR